MIIFFSNSNHFIIKTISVASFGFLNLKKMALYPDDILRTREHVCMQKFNSIPSKNLTSGSYGIQIVSRHFQRPSWIFQFDEIAPNSPMSRSFPDAMSNLCLKCHASMSYGNNFIKNPSRQSH